MSRELLATELFEVVLGYVREPRTRDDHRVAVNATVRPRWVALLDSSGVEVDAVVCCNFVCAGEHVQPFTDVRVQGCLSVIRKAEVLLGIDVTDADAMDLR